MMRRTLGLAVCAALLVLLSSTPAVAADVAVQEHIKDVDACGLVVDSSGHGIHEATISAMSGGNVLASSTTLSDGSFSFVQAVDSQVKIEVRAKGYVLASGSVERMGAGGGRKCRRPLYAVLAVGGGFSYLTAKKNKLPRSK